MAAIRPETTVDIRIDPQSGPMLRVAETSMAAGIGDGLDAAALLTLGQWLSPAYPIGAFAYSHGLENAIHDGLITSPAALSDWLALLLDHGGARSDAILLCLAHRAEGAALEDLADLAQALCPARERLVETQDQGRAFAQTTRNLWGFDLADMPYPVAVGRAAALARMPVGPVVLIYLQAVLSNLVQAAQRLMKLGQTAGQRILHDLAPLLMRTAGFALTAETGDLGTAVFASDIAAMRHEWLQPRIFRT